MTTSPAFLRIARPYVRSSLRRNFEGLYVQNLDGARALAGRVPLVLALNHVAWWDPLVVLALDGAMTGNGRALMDAHNLAKMPFFQWIGAIPIDRSAPARARAGLELAVATASDATHPLWIFPQGRQRPAHLRPLGLQPGVAHIARLAEATVLPVALQYGYREAPRPRIVVDVGAPIAPTALRRRDVDTLEEALVAGLARTDRFLDGEDQGFVPLLGGTRSHDTAGARVLARLARRPTEVERA